MKYLLLALPLLTTTPALAEFELPAGCTAYLTVQSKSCLVAHHYTCEGDPEGHRWRVDIDQSGPYYASQIDHETRWMFTMDLITGVKERLDEDSPDHASFSTLIREDRDDFEFNLTDSNGDKSTVRGYDRLTGKTVIIDDVPLLEAENDVTTRDANGDLVWHGKGREYISPEWRLFFAGPDQFTTPQGVQTYDFSPLEFIRPGARGFLAETPKFDCESIMSDTGQSGGHNDKI